jgi:DnaJ-class molecular chaperone
MILLSKFEREVLIMRIEKRVVLCPTCEGVGRIIKSYPHGEDDTRKCEECNGTGRQISAVTFIPFTEDIV